MGLFKPKSKPNGTVSDIETELQSLRDERSALVERETQAQQSRDNADNRLRELIADRGDGEAGKALAQDVHIAEIMRDRYSAEIRDLDSRIADAEQRLAEAKDKIERVATSKAIIDKTDTLSVIIERLRSTVADLTPAHEAVVPFVPFGNQSLPAQVHEHLLAITVSIEQTIADARANAEKIKAGTSPIVRSPEQPVEIAPPPDVECKLVFLTTDAKWDDVDGVRTAGKHRSIDLPVAIAEAAIKFGHGFDPTTEDGADRAMRLAHWKSPDYCVHDESISVDISRHRHPQIEATDPVASVPPHSAIEAEKIGEARQGTANVGRH
jgi:hypothetical protein